MLKRKLPVVALAVSPAAFLFFYNDMLMKEEPASIAISISTSVLIVPSIIYTRHYPSMIRNHIINIKKCQAASDNYKRMRSENRSISHGGVMYGVVGVSKTRRYENLHTANDDDTSFLYYIFPGRYELPERHSLRSQKHSNADIVYSRKRT